MGSQSRSLPTPPAFDAPLEGIPSEYYYAVRHGKTRTAWLPDGEKNIDDRAYVYSFRHNSRTWQTHGQIPHDGIGRAYACIASRGKNHRIFMKFYTQQQILNWMDVTWSKMKKVALDRLRVGQNVFLVSTALSNRSNANLWHSDLRNNLESWLHDYVFHVTCIIPIHGKTFQTSYILETN